MTPACDDIEIDLKAKTDRELLIMLVGKVNHVCHKVEKQDEVLFNNGWGIVAQTKVLWGLAAGVWAIVLIFITKAV